MSPAAPSEPQAAKKKSKKKKSKPAGIDTGEQPPPTPTDGSNAGNGEAEEDVESPTTSEPIPKTPTAVPATPIEKQAPQIPTTNGHKHRQSINGKPPAADSTSSTRETAPTTTTTSDTSEPSDTSARLEAMSRSREALRTEVEQVRKQLESLQAAHTLETTQLRTSLQDTEAAKDQAETQYQTLLGRVEKIKETLGDRLKRDRAELEEANQRIEELEGQNAELQKGAESKRGEVEKLKEDLRESERELEGVRSRSTLSQQNWTKVKDDLARQITAYKSELDSTSSAMSEWENIAVEERQMRESLTEKAADLEEQLHSLRDSGATAAKERDSSLQTVDKLQRALQEIQDARRKELRALVEASEEQAAESNRRVEEADRRASEAESAREGLAKEVERTAPFEKEVREKNLLIGKLRHEAIVLNDHLTKALRYLKKTKPEEQVDKQIISNYLVQFLALDRSDPKKFQILQVIAGYLSWTDEQRESAGLARPGGPGAAPPLSTSSADNGKTTSSNPFGSLRLPTSPFHRTPSTPSLGSEFFTEHATSTVTPSSATGKESLADLWAGFLERSVEEAGNGSTVGGRSKKESVSSAGTGAGAARAREESISTAGTMKTEPKT